MAYVKHLCSGFKFCENENRSYTESIQRCLQNKQSNSKINFCWRIFYYFVSGAASIESMLRSATSIAPNSHLYRTPKTLTCDYCPSSFMSPNQLSQHREQEHRHKLPYACRMCNKGFQTREGVRQHMLTHMARAFSCEVCDKKFKRKHHLKEHLTNVHSLQPCTHCSKTFTSLSHYHSHLEECAESRVKMRKQLMNMKQDSFTSWGFLQNNQDFKIFTQWHKKQL